MLVDAWQKLKLAIAEEMDIVEHDLKRESRAFNDASPQFLRGQLKAYKRVQDIMRAMETMR